jgi:hypothetical protein
MRACALAAGSHALAAFGRRKASATRSLGVWSKSVGSSWCSLWCGRDKDIMEAAKIASGGDDGGTLPSQEMQPPQPHHLASETCYRLCSVASFRAIRRDVRRKNYQHSFAGSVETRSKPNGLVRERGQRILRCLRRLSTQSQDPTVKPRRRTVRMPKIHISPAKCRLMLCGA